MDKENVHTTYLVEVNKHRIYWGTKKSPSSEGLLELRNNQASDSTAKLALPKEAAMASAATSEKVASVVETLSWK